jgi:hypothetical protein
MRIVERSSSGRARTTTFKIRAPLLLRVRSDE